VCVDLGEEVPCNEPQSDAVCECGRPSNGGTGGTGGTGGIGGLGKLGDSCESTDECDPNESDLGVFCCLEDDATCGSNLGECVEDCSQFSSGGEVRMFEDETCQDNNECAQTPTLPLALTRFPLDPPRVFRF